jgi:hypothetical protein
MAMTYNDESRINEIKREMSRLTQRKRQINTTLQVLSVELAGYEQHKIIESAKAARRRRCLVLELHISGMTLGQVAQRIGQSVHTVTGYIYQSEGSYSYALKLCRPDGHGRATFWRQHKLAMALRNLQCVVESFRLGGKLEDVKECE